MIVFIACMVVQSVHAQNLTDLYQLAHEADPALRSVHFEGKVSDELHKQSTALFMPNITAQFQTQKTEQKILRSDNAVFGQGKTRFPTQNYTASLTQPVFHVDAWHAFSQTKLGKMRADLELSAAQQDLMVRLVEAYLNALASEEDYALAVEEHKTLLPELESANIKYANGLSAVSELRDVEARTAEVEALVVASKAAVSDAREVLRSMVGISVDAIIPLRKDAILPAIDAMPVGEWVSQALMNNYTVRSNQMSVAIADKESDRLFAQHYPTVDLIARYNRRNTKGSLFGGGSKVDTADIILQVDLPIFAGGSMQSQTRASVYRYEQAKQDLEAVRRSVERDIRSGYATLLSNVEKISALKRVLESKRSLYELKREGYRAGINSLQAQLETQRDVYIAERNVTAARFDHVLTYINIQQASGELAFDDLEAINGLLVDGGQDSQSAALAPASMRPIVALPVQEKLEPMALPVLSFGSAMQVDAIAAIEVASSVEIISDIKAEAKTERISPVAVSMPVVVKTPAVVVPEVVMLNRDAVYQAEAVHKTETKTLVPAESVFESIERWRQAWISQDAEAYFSSYAEAFTPQFSPFEKWRKNRIAMLRDAKMIQVALNNVEIEELVLGIRVKATFLQFFNSDVFASEQRKTLELELHGHRWLIVSEWIN